MTEPTPRPVKDRDYWAKVHIAGDRNPPLNRDDRVKRRRSLLGSGVRYQRGERHDWTD